MKTNISILAEQLGQLLVSKGYSVTTAESCTAGGISVAITDVAGSSAWFDAGFVVYSNAMKAKVLNVSEALLDDFGAVSEEVVRAMVLGAQAVSGADVGVAVSGIAGPSGGSAIKPVGTVCFAVALNGAVYCDTCRFSGGRLDVRRASVEYGLKRLIGVLESEGQ